MVCAEHDTLATAVLRNREKQSSRTMALPHPSGPTNTKGWPLSNQGMTSDCAIATWSTITTPFHLPSTIPEAGASYRSIDEAATCSKSFSPVRRVRWDKKSSLSAGSMLPPNPRAKPRANSALLSADIKCESAFLMVPTFVVRHAVATAFAAASALKKYSSHHALSLFRFSVDWETSHPLTIREGSTASSDRKSIAVRETVAGDANFKSSHSKMKLTLDPN